VAIGIVHYLGESSNVPTRFTFGTNKLSGLAQQEASCWWFTVYLT